MLLPKKIAKYQHAVRYVGLRFSAADQVVRCFVILLGLDLHNTTFFISDF